MNLEQSTFQVAKLKILIKSINKHYKNCVGFPIAWKSLKMPSLGNLIDLANEIPMLCIGKIFAFSIIIFAEKCAMPLLNSQFSRK